MKKVTTKIIFLNLLLLSSIAAIIITTILINAQNKSDATVINISGKQRMLTQRISKNIFYQKISNNEELADFLMPIQEFELNLNSLHRGDAELGIYPPPNRKIEAKIEHIVSLWIRMTTSIQDFIGYKESSLKSMHYLMQENKNLLEISDLIVKEMVALDMKQQQIDRAGLQRMLSQQMIYNLMSYALNSDDSYLRNVLKEISTYEDGLKEFENLSQNLQKLKVHEYLVRNRTLWDEYSHQITQYISELKHLNLAIESIQQMSEQLLLNSDELTSLYTEYSQAQRENLERFQYLAALLITFIAIYSFVTIKGIKLQFDEFLSRSKALATMASDRDSYPKEFSFGSKGSDEFSEASGYLGEFLSKINAFSERSNDVKEISNRLADELLEMSEQLQKRIDSLDINDEQKKKLQQQISLSEDMIIQSSEEVLSAAKILENLKLSIDKIIGETLK